MSELPETFDPELCARYLRELGAAGPPMLPIGEAARSRAPVARAQGWGSVGLTFPGHFLVRLGDGAERLILDPFPGGQICEAAMLRELLKAMAGQEIELMAEHYAPVSDRDVLVRLQKNLKSRLLQAGRQEQAA